jgi:nicotinamidase-related amidase
MSSTALLIVDVQTGMINEHLFNGQNVISNIKNLIASARDNGREVIYVRHNDDELKHGSDEWQIYKEIAPGSNEKIFDKQFNSSFLKTGLKEYLESRYITDIILVGLQTEYCIDATCKAAFEHGFKVIMPEETNSTFDNPYMSAETIYKYFHNMIWEDRYVKVHPLNDVINMLEEK